MNPYYKLDRSVFHRMTAEEADIYQRDYSQESVEERMRVALYLISIAYDFDLNNPPRIDKTVFSASKQ